MWTDEETTKLIELWGEEDIQVRGWGMKLKVIEAATASTSITLLRERWCLSGASLHRDHCRLLFSEKGHCKSYIDWIDSTVITAITNFHVMHFEEVFAS